MVRNASAEELLVDADGKRLGRCWRCRLLRGIETRARPNSRSADVISLTWMGARLDATWIYATARQLPCVYGLSPPASARYHPPAVQLRVALSGPQPAGVWRPFHTHRRLCRLLCLLEQIAELPGWRRRHGRRG
jgi:hypothetical protein